MLDVFYKEFSKARVAGFAKVLAGAAVKGDAFCSSLFSEAGALLGSMARTLAPHLLPASAPAAAAACAADVAGLEIVCVGACVCVWGGRDTWQARAAIAGVSSSRVCLALSAQREQPSRLPVQPRAPPPCGPQ